MQWSGVVGLLVNYMPFLSIKTKTATNTCVFFGGVLKVVVISL